MGLAAALVAGFWSYRALQPAVMASTALVAPHFASDATRAMGAWNLDGNGRDSSGHGLQLILNLTFVARAGQLTLRAVNAVGGTPVFRSQ